MHLGGGRIEKEQEEGRTVRSGRGRAGRVQVLADSEDRSSYLVDSCFPVQHVPDLGKGCAGNKVFSFSVGEEDRQRIEP